MVLTEKEENILRASITVEEKRRALNNYANGTKTEVETTIKPAREEVINRRQAGYDAARTDLDSAIQAYTDLLNS